MVSAFFVLSEIVLGWGSYLSWVNSALWEEFPFVVGFCAATRLPFSWHTCVSHLLSGITCFAQLGFFIVELGCPPF